MHDQHCVDLLPVLVEYYEVRELAVGSKLDNLLQGETSTLVVLRGGKNLLK